MLPRDPHEREWTSTLLLVLVIAFLAGALFGYDQGVISGALAGLQRALSLTPFEVEVVTSWVTLGALGGSLAAGELADRLGRRRALLAAALLFAVGAATRPARASRARARPPTRQGRSRRSRHRCTRRPPVHRGATYSPAPGDGS